MIQVFDYDEACLVFMTLRIHRVQKILIIPTEKRVVACLQFLTKIFFYYNTFK